MTHPDSTSAACNILAIGEAMIELSNLDDQTLAWTFAGDSLNAAAAAAAAAPTGTVRYLTGIGDDSRSKQFLEFCDGLGVDASLSPVVDHHHLGLYWVETDGNERWFQYWRRNSAASHALTNGLGLPPLGPDDTVLTSGITLAVAGTGADRLIDQLTVAGEHGTSVAFDTNYRPALWREPDAARSVADRMCAVASMVIASVDDIAALWGDSPTEFCDRVARDHNEVIITDGARPIYASIGTRVVTAEPPTIDAVDPTGAGDAFFGTYVGSRAAGHAVESAIQRALEAGAAAAGAPGALGYLRP